MEGNGRVIRTLFMSKNECTDLLVENNVPFLNDVNEILEKHKKANKKITLIKIDDKKFGSLYIVIKEVFRMIRPHKSQMSLDEFLNHWNLCDKEKFKKTNNEVINDTVFKKSKYLFPKSLPKLNDNEKITTIGFLAESKNAQLLNDLFINELCPFFLFYYQFTNEPYIFVQHCNASLNTIIRTTTNEKILHYMIQVFLALYYMDIHYSMMHNDLFVKSIVVQQITKDMIWKGQVIDQYRYWSYLLPNGEMVTLKSLPYIIKINDLAFSSSFHDTNGLIRKDIYDKTLLAEGFPDSFQPQCDIMTFLNDMYLNLDRKEAFYCLSFIARTWEYGNIEEMYKDVLISGQSYRIKPDKLIGLNAKFLLDNIYSYFDNGCFYKTENVLLFF